MLTLQAHAKINWFLHILGLRKDGFHEIHSLIQQISLYDVISFELSEELIIETDADIPAEENLVFKAASLLKTTYGVRAGALIQLKKNIPLGAGLGGGSSDAAAALSGLNRLWSLKLSSAELASIAEMLGSDVPFFLHGPLSAAGGRGEVLTKHRAEKALTLLLIKPAFNISTAWAYRTFAETGPHKVVLGPASDKGISPEAELTKKDRKANNIEHFIRSIERADFNGINSIISNDLESVVIRNFPVIAEIKEQLISQGARFSLMSGSGSTLFGVFDSCDKAESASRSFKGFWTAVAETITD
jgi:4-diphosphocytidyl-2-C-methyl-D-erythritol kinase